MSRELTAVVEDRRPSFNDGRFIAIARASDGHLYTVANWRWPAFALAVGDRLVLTVNDDLNITNVSPSASDVSSPGGTTP